MSLDAKRHARGSREPRARTSASSVLPPSQEWFMKRATLPLAVASMLRRRAAPPLGIISRTTSSACPWRSAGRRSYSARRSSASIVVSSSPAYSQTNSPAGTPASATSIQPLAPFSMCIFALKPPWVRRAEHFAGSQRQAGPHSHLVEQLYPEEFRQLQLSSRQQFPGALQVQPLLSERAGTLNRQRQPRVYIKFNGIHSLSLQFSQGTGNFSCSREMSALSSCKANVADRRRSLETLEAVKTFCRSSLTRITFQTSSSKLPALICVATGRRTSFLASIVSSGFTKLLYTSSGHGTGDRRHV
mmetsp:Transcript_10275/g.24504  ORF Transcript_10275/g.24504 Transcript_10275/m.24504 type:complete len:302 (+) Transcript_10275:257-1162(+)